MRASRFVTRLAAIALVAAAAARAEAKVHLSQQEALALAFPGGAEPSRRTAFLTDGQAAAIEKESGQPLPTRIITYYERDGVTAYFDTHVVRTLPETIMVVVSPQATIVRIDILSFAEPADYLPRPAWSGQLAGRALDRDLSLRGSIRPMTGATLTARAIVGAARRILSIHGALARQAQQTKPADGSAPPAGPDEKPPGEKRP